MKTETTIEAIEGMVAVEEAAHHCANCAPGAFCSKHDDAFWEYWREAKRHLPTARKPVDNKVF